MRYRRSQAGGREALHEVLGQVDEKKASRTRASLGALLDEWLPGAALGNLTRGTTTSGSSIGSSGPCSATCR